LARATLKTVRFQNRRWDSDPKTRTSNFGWRLGDIVEAEFHFDRYNPKLSPKQHKETTNSGAGILKDLGPHLIDQAFIYLAFLLLLWVISESLEDSLVDDWIDIVLYYDTFRVRLKASFFVRESIPAYQVHGKKGLS
jgi:predicted dehydrogenase